MRARFKNPSQTAVFNVSTVSATKAKLDEGTLFLYFRRFDRGPKCHEAPVHVLFRPKQERHSIRVSGRPFYGRERKLKAKFQQRGSSQFLLPTELQKQSWKLLDYTSYIFKLFTKRMYARLLFRVNVSGILVNLKSVTNLSACSFLLC
jgi:hypothetical protein